MKNNIFLTLLSVVVILIILNSCNSKQKEELENSNDRIYELENTISDLEIKISELESELDDCNRDQNYYYDEYINMQSQLSDCERKVAFGW